MVDPFEGGPIFVTGRSQRFAPTFSFVLLVQRGTIGDLYLGVLPFLLLWFLRAPPLRRSQLHLLRDHRFAEVSY